MPLAAPAPGTAYGIPFLTLRDVTTTPNAAGTGFTVSCNTDALCTLKLDWWQMGVANPTINSISDSFPSSAKHAFTASGLTGMQGSSIGFRIYLDPLDGSGLTLRDYFGTFRSPGARGGTTNPPTPVRFYNFGGNGQPLPGNQQGNWSTYTWAQWNPNGKAFPQ